MMANVKLSVSEKELVMNKEFILTKIAIIDKVYTLFGELAESYRVIAEPYQQQMPAEIFQQSPKISKGENYLQLPYVMLDYPRKFIGEDMFAVRSFFWWGNFFSIFLIVSGSYKTLYGNQIMQQACKDNWFICVNESPWHHHFETDNFIPAAGFQKINTDTQNFLKTGKFLTLDNWDKTYDFFLQNFNKIFESSGS